MKIVENLQFVATVNPAVGTRDVNQRLTAFSPSARRCHK
jgi:hypothetical protein